LFFGKLAAFASGMVNSLSGGGAVLLTACFLLKPA
jgi:hypothetical protein